VSTFFGGCGKIPAIFLIAFLNSPSYETPKNAIKKTPSKTTEREKKKTRGEKSRIFCDEPRCFFRKKSFYRAFELPLSRNAQKNAIKKIDEKKEKKK
jgi:hypothetical protein